MKSHSTASCSSVATGRNLPNGIDRLLGFVAICSVLWLGASTAAAQDFAAEFHQILREKSSFSESDFVAVARGESVVRLMPPSDKREVAVSGLIGMQIPAEVFLQSYRESMTQKTNSAILEIGRFSGTPNLTDLETLTFEDRDIDDLRECVVGDCKLKLSAAMIERLHKEVDWTAPDFRIQASRLLKLMLVEYVRDYLQRGDAALINYHDQREEVRLADEQRELKATSLYLDNVVVGSPQTKEAPGMVIVENAIVWSKIKFGLKPVIAFNHIIVFRTNQASGAQVLALSRGIYANHYFDSSLALTALVKMPGAHPGPFLFYENRMRADALGGVFGKFKRSIVENKAVTALKTLLESSRVSFNAKSLKSTESASQTTQGSNWARFSVNRIYLVIATLVTTFLALFAFGNYYWKAGIGKGVRY